MSDIRERLHEEGGRMTRQREVILQILESAAEPLTAQEIHQRCGDSVDQASVYRSLHYFSALGVVHELRYGDKTVRYQSSSRPRRHDHHIVCVDCGKLESIGMCLAQEVRKATGFSILDHRIEFVGRCGTCSASASHNR